MTQCSETGCNEKATHKYRAQSGFKVPLCDGHHKEWEKYEYKRSPVMMLIELGKWLIRLTGVLTILFGVLTIGFAAYSIIQSVKLSFVINISLIFFDFYLYLEDALMVSASGILILLVGLALFYIGFMKMEHDLW